MCNSSSLKHGRHSTYCIENTVAAPLTFSHGRHRTFTYSMKSPPSSYFLKAAAGVVKGAQQPGKGKVGILSLKHIYEIAVIKHQDPNLAQMSLESMCRSLIGSAKSMGIEVVKKIP